MGEVGADRLAPDLGGWERVQGRFSSHTLAETLRDLYAAERSGILHLSRGETRKEILFERGMIVCASSQAEDEDLGRSLVREGRISPGALAEARRSIADPRALGQVLVNRGLVSRAALSQTARRITERVVESVFRWEGGAAEFADGGPFPSTFDADILLTFELIMRGIGVMSDFDPIRESLREIESKLRICRPAPVPVERLTLSPAHGFILSRADGDTTVQDILSILPPGEEDVTCRFLFALLIMGILAFDPPLSEGPIRVSGILRTHADQAALESLQEKLIVEAYAGLPGKTPSQILGVEPDSPAEEIERAYEDAKERFGREKIQPRVRDKFRSELAVIESRLLESYVKLSETPSAAGGTGADSRPAREAVDVEAGLVRLEMDKTRTKMDLEENVRVADGYHAKARKYMREGDYHNAIQYGKLAISYNPEDARFYFLLAECHGRNPEGRWQRIAEQNYIKATELDPWNAEYRMHLGRFYKRRGLNLRARKQFESALKISPGLDEAAREIASLH